MESLPLKRLDGVAWRGIGRNNRSARRDKVNAA
jgi:hypothetical protein